MMRQYHHLEDFKRTVAEIRKRSGTTYSIQHMARDLKQAIGDNVLSESELRMMLTFARTCSDAERKEATESVISSHELWCQSR
jgi:uncharacterized protein (DUF2344 family)